MILGFLYTFLYESAGCEFLNGWQRLLCVSKSRHGGAASTASLASFMPHSCPTALLKALLRVHWTILSQSQTTTAPQCPRMPRLLGSRKEKRSGSRPFNCPASFRGADKFISTFVCCRIFDGFSTSIAFICATAYCVCLRIRG